MTAAELQTLSGQLLWAGFALAFVFGWIAQRTHFCTMGAIGDILNMGDWTRMRMWTLAVGVAMVGFWSLAAAGSIDATQVVYASQRWIWLSALTGGLLFGLGMVLASGCPNRSLLRLGAGNLKALVVLVVMGMAATATISGPLAEPRIRSVNQIAFETTTVSSLMPSWLAQTGLMSLSLAGWILAVLIGAGLMLWALRSQDFRASKDNLLAGFGLGLLVVAMWWITGHLAFVPEHPETLEAIYLGAPGNRFEALSFVAPVARTLDWAMGSRSISMGVMLVLGLLLGAGLQAWRQGTFRWQGFRSTQDLVLHLVGAVCMGVGGVTAGGCTIGHGLSGLSTLNLMSVVALTGIVLGCIVGMRVQVWLLGRQA
jgi:uncharacterized membrane protein YedE/YeeE